MDNIPYNVFNNITPATFQDSYTYIQQIRILKEKLNEVIEVVNQMNSQEVENND